MSGLANRAELLAAIETWRDRISDTTITTNAADCLTLGEARLNRELRLNRMFINTPLTGTLDSRELTIPTDYDEPKFLKRTDTNPYCPLTKKASERMVYYSTSGTPSEWCINGANIDLNRPCSSALVFSFRYRQRFMLTVSAPTNWLLTYNSDIYLASVLLNSGLLIEAEDVGEWNGILQNGITMLKQLDAKADGDVDLEIDPALLRNGRYDFTNDISY